jgi:hypothetical protein
MRIAASGLLSTIALDSYAVEFGEAKLELLSTGLMMIREKENLNSDRRLNACGLGITAANARR